MSSTSTSVNQLPLEGTYLNLDEKIIESLKLPTYQPHECQRLTQLRTSVKSSSNQEHIWKLLDQHGQMVYQIYWSLYSDVFYELFKNYWNQLEIGKQIVSLQFLTIVYTQINDQFHQQLFNLPFGLIFKCHHDRKLEAQLRQDKYQMEHHKQYTQVE